MYIALEEIYKNGKLIGTDAEDYDLEDDAINCMLSGFNCAINPDRLKEGDTWGQEGERYCWKKSGEKTIIWSIATF